jgi:hypothetical protein
LLGKQKKKFPAMFLTKDATLARNLVLRASFSDLPIWLTQILVSVAMIGFLLGNMKSTRLCTKIDNLQHWKSENARRVEALKDAATGTGKKGNFFRRFR